MLRGYNNIYLQPTVPFKYAVNEIGDVPKAMEKAKKCLLNKPAEMSEHDFSSQKYRAKRR